MTYTSHGHHIPGTLMGADRPNEVARCGGPGICGQCSNETIRHQKNQPSEIELSMEFTKYVRKPFLVEAVEITTENIEELSELIGEFKNDEYGPYIEADREKVPTVQKVVPGYWVTKMGKNIRCYSANVFRQQFIEGTESVLERAEAIINA